MVGNRASHTAGTSIASGINILRQGPPAVVCPAQESTIVGNTSSHNRADGIFVGTNSRGNTIHRNTVEDNGLSGIFLGGPAFANQFTNVGPTAFGVVTFNEGQAGRTTHQFGSVGPVAIPVLSAEYAVGIELKNLTTGADPVVVQSPTPRTSGCRSPRGRSTTASRTTGAGATAPSTARTPTPTAAPTTGSATGSGR